MRSPLLCFHLSLPLDPRSCGPPLELAALPEEIAKCEDSGIRIDSLSGSSLPPPPSSSSSATTHAAAGDPGGLVEGLIRARSGGMRLQRGVGLGGGRLEPGLLTRAVDSVFRFVRLAEFEILFVLFFLIAFLLFKDLMSRPQYNQIFIKNPDDGWP